MTGRIFLSLGVIKRPKWREFKGKDKQLFNTIPPWAGSICWLRAVEMVCDRSECIKSRSCFKSLNLDMAMWSSRKQTSRTKPFEICSICEDRALMDGTLCVPQSWKKKAEQGNMLHYKGSTKAADWGTALPIKQRKLKRVWGGTRKEKDGAALTAQSVQK